MSCVFFFVTWFQKSSQRQLVNHVFPKLAVYNSVDPSLAPSLLMVCSSSLQLEYFLRNVNSFVVFFVFFFLNPR